MEVEQTFHFPTQKWPQSPTQQTDPRAIELVVGLVPVKHPLRYMQFTELQYNKIANLISKLNFYKLIPYPMDNMLNRSAQTGPPNVRKRRPVFPPAGRSSHCIRQVACRTSFLSRQADVIASFSLSKPIRPLVN